MACGVPHSIARNKITMSAIAQQAQVAKTVAVSTGKVANAKSMMVWRPHGNKMFETFSFLPPLSDAEISKQVQYLLNNGWTPCVEFEDEAHAYADGHGWSGMDSSINAGYYDNRYWVMWKLPMYGCQNTDEVLAEVKAATKAFPDCYIRVAGFDNIKQVQCASFLVHRPASGAACAVDNRQVKGN
jgi:ribulose-bisphosphate carboxylase small chain